MLEGLNVSSGINSGMAQVYDMSGSLNQYTKFIQQQKARKAAQQKDLNDKLSKMNAEGLRPEDREQFLKNYEVYKQETVASWDEKDSKKKFERQQTADAAHAKALDVAYRSKEKTKRDASVIQERMKDPYLFDDEGNRRFDKSFHAPVDSPDDIVDYSTLPKGVDLQKIKTFVQSQDKWLLDNKARESNTSTVLEKYNVGEDAYEKRESMAIVPPEEQNKLYTDLYFNNRPFEAYIEKKYPQFFDGSIPDELEAVKSAIWEEVKANPLQKPSVRTQKVGDSFADHKRNRQYDIANPLKGSGSGEQYASPAPISIPYNEGKATVDFDEYVPISLSKKNFAGATPIDLKTGKPGTRLASSNDYEIVGVGNVPIIKSGSNAKKEFWGTISQPDFAKNNPDAIQRTPIIHVQIPAKGELGRPKDFFVPYDRLPENVKNSKQVREALGKFKPANVNQQPSKQGKAFSPAIENGINAVMKKNNISREAAIKALRAAKKF